MQIKILIRGIRDDKNDQKDLRDIKDKDREMSFSGFLSFVAETETVSETDLNLIATQSLLQYFIPLCPTKKPSNTAAS